MSKKSPLEHIDDIAAKQPKDSGELCVIAGVPDLVGVTVTLPPICRICEVKPPTTEWQLCDDCYKRLPFACCECGVDLTADEVRTIGSRNLCEDCAPTYH